MNNIIIKIAPVTVEITDLKIQLEYVLNSGVKIYYSLLHSEGNPYKIGMVNLTPEEFAAWGTDDNYIEDLVLSKLNLQRA